MLLPARMFFGILIAGIAQATPIDSLQEDFHDLRTLVSLDWDRLEVIFGNPFSTPGYFIEQTGPFPDPAWEEFLEDGVQLRVECQASSSVDPAPEPASLALAASGALTLGFLAYCRRRLNQ